jgi:hypothetical protein
MTNITIGDNDPRRAAAEILLQFANRIGLPPGHAGAFHGDPPEPLASREVVAAIEASAHTGRSIGYFCLTDEAYFEGRTGADFSGRRYTRHTKAANLVVSLTSADINALLGPGGIRSLRDPVDHPVTKQHLLAAGLRPESLGALPE